jgi:hypothetical protein
MTTRVSDRTRRIVRYAAGAVGVIGVAGSLAAFRPRASAIIVTKRQGDDTLVINQVNGTRLAVTVLDQYGRPLNAATTTRYERIDGDMMTVSANGDLNCEHRRDDVVIRATHEKISKRFVVRCRPVEWIEAPSWVELMVGDSARDLAFTARGPDGRVVTELRGAMRIENSAIVAMTGTSLRAKQPGFTFVTIEIGNARTGLPVGVYEPVKSFDNTPTKPMMGMRIAQARGDTLEVPVPKAAFWITYYSNDPAVPPPTIELRGPGACATGDGLRVRRVEAGTYGKYCNAGAGAKMMIAHGATGADTVRGFVAVRLMWP